jgi:hypothetical protein
MPDADKIRAKIVERAEQLGMTPYAIAKKCEIDPGTIKRYFTGRCSLSSRYVSAICDVLGLELREIE